MYTIKEATVTDAETIHQLANEIWWPTYSPILTDDQIDYMLADRYATDTLTDQIAKREQTYLLVMDDDKPVAFAGFSPDKSNPDIYRLHKLYSLPATQGKGVGKLLLNAIYERVLAAGKNLLELNVHRLNPAKGFYEKMGFKIVHEVDIPFGPYFLNDYIMQKEL